MQNNKLIIDNNLCLARKNQKIDFYKQCPFHRKDASEYCGKHKTYLQKKCIPININPSKFINSKERERKISENLKNSANNKSISNSNNNLNSINNNLETITNDIIELPIKSKCRIINDGRNNKLTKKKHMYTIKPYEYHKISKSGLTLIDYLYDKNLKYSNAYLKKSYKFYNLDFYSIKKKRAYTKEDKEQEITLIKTKLQNLFETLLRSYIFVEKIIFLQKTIRNYLKDKKVRLHGPAINNRELCNNPTDFYSFDDLKEIENKFFFSYKDSDGFIYGFHIESFINLISNDTEPSNPYNRILISKKHKDTAVKIWQQLTKNKDMPNYTNTTLINGGGRNLKNQVRNKCLTVLQKIDMFGYQTKLDWILELPISRARQLFRALRNYWNYKAGLTEEVKNRIYPDGNILQNVNIRNIERNINRYIVINSILDFMDLLVSSGVSDDDKNQGSILILFALNDVNREVSRCNSWLV
jgi:hypothetical protein